MIKCMIRSHSYSHWLTALVGLLLFVQLGGLARSLQLSQTTLTALSMPQPLLFASYVVWIGAFGWGFLHMLRGADFAKRRALWLIGGFIIYSILRLGLFARAEYDEQRLPFLVVGGLTTLIILAIGNRLARRIQKGDFNL